MRIWAFLYKTEKRKSVNVRKNMLALSSEIKKNNNF